MLILQHPSLPSCSTELHIGENLLAEKLLVDLCQKQRVVIIADAAVKDLYGTDLAKRLNAELLTIPSGEKAKSKNTQENLENELFKRGCDRDTILIALGGGVTTDLVGFVASIYLRGVSLILIPTTLLAMVDAAIGGKTAINTDFGKNLIGTNYLPKAIIADLKTLATLPEKEWLNGVAEILKMGLVFDASIWELAKKNSKSQELILKAIQAKMDVVEQDPTEQGLRRILNFGHTIGHALEKIAHYEMSHGEAVAIGCLAESHLSMHLGYLPEKEFEQIQSSYNLFSLKLPKNYTRQNLFMAMSHDKKKAQGHIRFVLIDQIGHALSFDGHYCCAITEKQLEATLDWMEKNYG